jgi:hypothetical protein
LERGVKEERTHIQFEDIKQRFGLVEKSHRIGEIDIKVSQVKRVDEMVAETYPDAVATHGDAPVWVITWPPAFGLAEYLLLNRLIMILFYF